MLYFSENHDVDDDNNNSFFAGQEFEVWEGFEGFVKDFFALVSVLYESKFKPSQHLGIPTVGSSLSGLGMTLSLHHFCYGDESQRKKTAKSVTEFFKEYPVICLNRLMLKGLALGFGPCLYLSELEAELSRFFVSISFMPAVIVADEENNETFSVGNFDRALCFMNRPAMDVLFRLVMPILSDFIVTLKSKDYRRYVRHLKRLNTDPIH